MEKPFVEVLKEYRKKKKLTQQQLADKLNYFAKKIILFCFIYRYKEFL